jgi:hypothetical protein
MNQSEKETLLQFMGQVYGETKKNDQLLVGQSQQLQPRAEQVKQQFTQVLKAKAQPSSPVQPYTQPDPTLEAVNPHPVTSPQPVTPEQAARELAQVAVTPEQATQEQVVDPNQLEFDLSEPTQLDKIISLLESQNKLLVEIRDSSIKSKYNAKRAKNQKPQ